MGANYFRLDKAAVIWANPSFDNSSQSQSQSESESAETESESLTDTLTMSMHVAYQDVPYYAGIQFLTQTNWKMADSGKVHVQWGVGTAHIP
jgi:hypothetical protein